MASIKTRKTNNGLTYHLIDKTIGLSRKLPVRSISDARQYLFQYLGDVAGNRPNSLSQTKVLFKDLVKDYLSASKSEKNESSYSRDLSHLKPLMVEWENLHLNRIDTFAIEQAFSKWLKQGKSKKTIKNRLILLSVIFSYAIKRKLMIEKPAFPKIKIDRKVPTWFSTEQVHLILDSVRPFVRDFVLVFLHTGLRSGELKRLKWDDIDFKNNNLIVEIAKSHKSRAIPLNGVLRECLFNRRPKDWKGKYVFCGEDENTFSDFYKAFKRELKRLGITKGSIHTLRHTFASNLVQKGANIYEVKELLGHASVQTTQIYCHLRMENLSNAVRLLESDFVFGGTTGVPSKILELKSA